MQEKAETSRAVARWLRKIWEDILGMEFFFSALRNPTSKKKNTAAERGGNETRAAAATAVELRYIVLGGDDF